MKAQSMKDENENNIVRLHGEDGVSWANICGHELALSDLKLNELKLLLSILSNDSNFKIIAKHIKNKLGWRDNKFELAWKGLKEKGYIVNVGNPRRGAEFRVFESPILNPFHDQ